MALVDRGTELDALAAAGDAASSGGGSVVVVSGESGVGKTALVRSFVESTPGSRVLWSACDPLSTPRPLGCFLDLAGDLGLSGEPVGPGDVTSFAEAVHAAMRAERLVVVIDDLQWGDQASIDLLRYLVRRIGATSTLLVLVCRDDDVPRDHPLRLLLGDVARADDATAVRVRPLSREGVAALTEGSGLDPEVVHRISGGNAFFVTQVVANPTAPLPPTVRDAVLGRVHALDPEALEALELVACAPGGLAHQLLPELGVDLPALRRIDATGLTARTTTGIAFRHELARLAVLDAIPPGGEPGLHQRILLALEHRGFTDPAVCTAHAVAAHDPLRAHRYAVLAARSAVDAGAHTEAVAFLRTALGSTPADDLDERARLLQVLAFELYTTSHLPEGLDAIREAARLRARAGDVSALAAAHQVRAILEFYAANGDEAARQAGLAASVASTGEPNLGLGYALGAQAYLALHTCELDAAGSLGERARSLAVQLGDPALRLRAEIIIEAAALMGGAAERRPALVEHILEAHERSLDELASTGFSNLVHIDVEHGRLDEADGLLRTSLPFAVDRGIAICHVWQLGVRARLHLVRGQWQAAVEDATEALGLERAPLAEFWPHLVIGLVGLRAGDGPGDHLEAAWALAERIDEPLRRLQVAAALIEQVWTSARSDVRVSGAEGLLAAARGRPGLERAGRELAWWLRTVGIVDDDAADPADPDDSEPATIGDPFMRALALVTSSDPDTCRVGVELLDLLGAVHTADRVRRDLRVRGVDGLPARPRATTRSNPGGLTNRQLEVARLLGEGRTNAELAAVLSISEKTADHHVSAVLLRLGVAGRREVADALAALEGRPVPIR